MKNTKSNLVGIHRPVTFLRIILVITVGLLSQSSYAATQVSQFGITWTFDKDYTTGQFANDDYWVVGPVNITSVSPAWDGEKNGAMVNPIIGGAHGYDARPRENLYDPNLRASFPLVLQAGESLVSTIGIEDYGGYQGTRCLQTAAILTALSEVPPTGSFRPPYTGYGKPIYSSIGMKKELLLSLAPVSGTVSLATAERYFERVWLEHLTCSSYMEKNI